MTASPTWWRPGLLVIVGIAIAVRVAFALALAADLEPSGDAELYRTTAQHLVDGHGFVYAAPGGGPLQPSAEHPPLFPLLLAGLDLVGLGSVRAQGVALAVLSGAGVALVAYLGRRVLDARVGLVAAAIAAVHPMWTQSAGIVLSEAVYLVMVPLVLLAALELRARRDTMSAITLGAAIVGAGLTRPEGFALLLVVAVPAALFGALRSRQAWRQLGVVTLVVVAGVTPWLLYNHARLDAWTISTNGGKTLLGSNCADTFAGPRLGGFSYDCQFGAAALLVEQGPPEGEWWDSRAFDDRLGDIGREFLDDHRDEAPKVVAARIARMWGLRYAEDQRQFDVEEGRHEGLQHIGQWVHLGVLALAVAGSLLLVRRRARWPELVVLLGPIVLVTATCLLIYGGTRMRTGAEPSLAVLAAVTVGAMTGPRGGRR